MNRFLETKVLPNATNIYSYAGEYSDGSKYIGIEFTFGRRNVSIVLNKKGYHLEIGTQTYYDLSADVMEDILSMQLMIYF